MTVRKLKDIILTVLSFGVFLPFLALFTIAEMLRPIPEGED